MNTLLVPIDFSPVSRAVMAQAAKIARMSRSRVILLHVIQPPPVLVEYGPLLESAALFTAQARKGATRHLDRLGKGMRARGITTETVLRVGIPDAEILDEAAKRSVSSIVIGSHGHTAFYDLLLGSTTSSVLRRAKCPVYVVPARRRGKSLAARNR
jgi:nucleotide-binding universal stress UspA family protein